MDYTTKTLQRISEVTWVLFVLLTALIVFTKCSVEQATADTVESTEPLETELTSAQVDELINGTKTQAGQFVYAKLLTLPGGYCTATLVGPRVIVTAAHCATAGTASITHGGVTYQYRLTPYPFYRGNSRDLDIALGVSGGEVVLPYYASIGTRVKAGTRIILTGTGCTRLNGTGWDGVLRWGRNSVTRIINHDLEVMNLNEAVICSGDSGGAAFLDDQNNGFGPLQLISINSRSYVDENNNRAGSLLAQVGEMEGVEWMGKWASENGVSICGISTPCTGTEPTPGPTSTPVPTVVPTMRPTTVPTLQPTPRPTATPHPSACKQAIIDFDSILFSSYDLRSQSNKQLRKKLDEAYDFMDECKDAKKDGQIIR